MVIKGLMFIVLAYIIAYNTHKIYCSYKGIPHTQVRLHMDFIGNYEVQVKLLNIIWVSVWCGNTINLFKKYEIDEVKTKLKSGEYYIKYFMLYEKNGEDEEFLI